MRGVTVGRALALQVINLGSIPSTPDDFPSLSRNDT